MASVSEVLKESKKIVIKIGSNVLSNEDGRVNKEVIKNIADQVAKLQEMGKQIIIVSSGAGICGVGAIKKWSRKDDMNYKQALCAIGQVELMLAYKEYFNEHNTPVAQMLLTRGDFESDQRTLNIRNALFTLMDEGVVPIINENDSVSVEEIKIGDNDTLGALTANLWNADALVMLSDIDGVFDKDPKSNLDAKLIQEVSDIYTLEDTIKIEGKSSFGTGGIATKIQAAKIASKYGVKSILLNGKKSNVILQAIENRIKGTAF